MLLVASSRSFGAVNREQFYVSISRGRQSCHIFTDDKELLQRRVTDSHQRKAAVELDALRVELAKLGFRPQLPRKETGSSTGPRFRVVRSMRETRPTRLAPVQRLVQVPENVARWLGEHLGVEDMAHSDQQPVAENIEQSAPTESVQEGKAVQPKPTLKPAVQHKHLGPRIFKRRPGGHSRGIGV